jgi:DNA-binding LytR/AlgR family response regulator
MVIGICDDEKIIVDILSGKIKECLAMLGMEAELLTMQSGRKVLEAASQLDVVFLDIEMPELNGIETGKLLKAKNPNCHIILATSKTEYYKDGFKIDALRYVTKPFEQDELMEALQAVMKTYIGSELISLYDSRTLVEIPHRAIAYIAAFDSYVEFVLKNRIIRTQLSLNELEKVMNKRIFFRIHKKYIVNMLHIENYRDGIVMIGTEKMTVARRKKKEFERAYMECDLNYR